MAAIAVDIFKNVIERQFIFLLQIHCFQVVIWLYVYI